MNSWRDNVRKVEPYTPGEQPKEEGVIKVKIQMKTLIRHPIRSRKR